MAVSKIIDEFPMFKMLTDDEKKQVAEARHSFAEFKKGEIIIKEGENCSSLYLLIQGTVVITKISENAQIRLAKLKPGEIFGEISFVSRKPRLSNVVANEDVSVLKLDEAFFEHAELSIRDKAKNYFIEVLVQRLDSMNESIMHISKLMHM